LPTSNVPGGQISQANSLIFLLPAAQNVQTPALSRPQPLRT
jgi:hypothetical protein